MGNLLPKDSALQLGPPSWTDNHMCLAEPQTKRVLSFRSSFHSTQPPESLGLGRNRAVQSVSPASFVKFHDCHWGSGEGENEPRESGY